MPTLVTLFCTILTDMRGAIGAFMARSARPPQAVWLGTRVFVPAQQPAPVPTDLLTLAWTRIGRAMQRFARLHERWRTNTLPPPRPRAAPAPGREEPFSFSPPALGRGEPEGGQPARLRPSPKLRLPRRRAWLAHCTDYRVRGHAAQLEHLLSQPDAHAFLAAVPRAGRILRPLCHMLGIDPPAVPKLPIKPRPPRRRPEKPEPEPVRRGKHTDAQIRRYSPGRIPDAPGRRP